MHALWTIATDDPVAWCVVSLSRVCALQKRLNKSKSSGGPKNIVLDGIHDLFTDDGRK